MKLKNLFFLLFLVLLISCKTQYIASSHNENIYLVKDSLNEDTISAIEQYIKPFRDSVSGIMNEVIGIADGDFHKQKNGGSLGNLITDAMYEKASKLKNIDGAIFNPGGIRMPDLMKGNITKGKMHELLPFDNELVIMEIKGEILVKWLNHIANGSGWPICFKQQLNEKVRKDITFRFKNNNLIQNKIDTSYVEKIDGDIMMYITNNKINIDSTYFIATNDYIANGGDNCVFLKDQNKLNTGILIRDLVSEYITIQKVILPNNDQRMQFEK